MGKENSVDETIVPISHPSISPIKKLVCKLKKLTSVQKLNFLKKIKKSDLGLIIELVFNYIRGNIITEFNSHHKFKKKQRILIQFNL